MARLPVITEEKADGHTKEVFDAIKSKFGMVPNIFKGMANSSVTLDSFLKLDELIRAACLGSFAFPLRMLTIS